MGQITINLEDKLEHRMRKAAAQAEVSPSQWIANLIHERLTNEWPAEIRALPGKWNDFPDLATLRTDMVQDSPRTSL